MDLSSAPTWSDGGPLQAVELSPPVEVEPWSALVEATVQPGVASDPDQVRQAPSPRYSFGAPAAWLIRLEDAILDTCTCLAMSPRFGFVAQSVHTRAKLLDAGYVLHETGEITVPGRETVSVDFPAVNMALPYERHNYFHWLFEALGGFLIARSLIPPEARVAVRLELAPFEAEALAAVGISPDSVFVLPPDRFVHFPELYVLPRTYKKGRPSPIAASALRKLVDVHADPAGPRRIYVTRQTADRRRIVNHDEVGVVLARHGFAEIAAEGLSVREQIALFAQAEAIVGVHGSGLANAVFSAPGTLLVELQPERRKPLYWNMAAICGLRYIGIVCKSLTPRKKNDTDLEVDCSHLDAILTRHLPVEVAALG